MSGWGPPPPRGPWGLVVGWRDRASGAGTCPRFSLRPSFSKLEQWLETLRMHLEIHLPLSSQLEQLDRAFGETHRWGEGGLPAPPR